MKFTSIIVRQWHHVPFQVRTFLTRAFLICIGWKVLYYTLLFPLRFPDVQLTRATAATAAYFYKLLLQEPHVFYREDLTRGYNNAIIYVQDKRAVGIADACNGLELYVLFIAFLFCIPTSLKRQIAFVALGCAIIFLTNGLRCFGLAWLFLHKYPFANFAHHYLFKMIIYAIIFYLWVLYSKKSFAYAS